jgi:hypothetical protein
MRIASSVDLHVVALRRSRGRHLGHEPLEVPHIRDRGKHGVRFGGDMLRVPVLHGSPAGSSPAHAKTSPEAEAILEEPHLFPPKATTEERGGG